MEEGVLILIDLQTAVADMLNNRRRMVIGPIAIPECRTTERGSQSMYDDEKRYENQNGGAPFPGALYRASPYGKGPSPPQRRILAVRR